MSENKLKIGITQGDTNGVGWEILLKIFADSRMCDICTPIIYGSAKAAEHYKGCTEEQMPSFYKVSSAREAREGKVNLVECGTPTEAITPGVASLSAGRAAIEALEKATEELRTGIIDAMVTSPFNKESVQSESFAFTGHTEYVASKFEGQAMMMMCSQTLKVGLVTKHIPLSEIGASLTVEKIVADINSLRASLKKDFSIVEPRIAVLALNPHAGEGGMLGGEELQIIQPAIVEAYKGGALAFGPFAADGFFAAQSYTKYDAVLAIYHDQGLIPFKTLSPEGVNFTAGVTAVRTSPDHGVAYDIAGKGEANADSTRNAIYTAIDIVRSRRNYLLAHRNPLQRAEREKPHRDMSLKDLQRQEHSHHGHREHREHREPRENREPREPRTPSEN